VSFETSLIGMRVASSAAPLPRTGPASLRRGARRGRGRRSQPAPRHGDQRCDSV